MKNNGKMPKVIFSDEYNIFLSGVDNIQALDYFKSLLEKIQSDKVFIPPDLLYGKVSNVLKLNNFTFFCSEHNKEEEIYFIRFTLGTFGESVVNINFHLKDSFIEVYWNVIKEFPMNKLEIILNKKTDLYYAQKLIDNV